MLGILLASLLPMTLVLALFHDHLMDDARELLDHRAQRSHQEISRLLADAENQLEKIAAAVATGDPGILDILQHAEYRTAYFREAGVIDEKGYLTITNLGPINCIPSTAGSDRCRGATYRGGSTGPRFVIVR